MNKLVIFLFVILVLVVPAGAAQAADWILACNSEGWNRSYIDTTDLKLQNYILTYSLKTEFEDPSKTKGAKTAISKVDYNYSSNKFRLPQSTRYYESGKSESSQLEEWVSLPPLGSFSDSTGAAIYTLFASQKWTQVDDSVAFYNPVRNGGYLFFCLKFKPDNADDFSYAYIVYDDRIQSALTYFMASKAPESSKYSRYYFFHLRSLGFSPLNKDTPINKAINKVLANINETN